MISVLKIKLAFNRNEAVIKCFLAFLVLNIMASLPVKKCPNCGQDMTLKTKKDGKGWGFEIFKMKNVTKDDN